MIDNQAEQSTYNLNRWYESYAGKLLARIENQYLKEILGSCFGYYLLSAGHLYHAECLQHAKIKFRVLADVEVTRMRGIAPLMAIPEQLPIMNDSLDTLILSHCMEFSPDPHLILREADRILIPEGNLIIMGFNPYSLWGTIRLMRRKTSTLPWSGNFISINRIKDWLELLGFAITMQRHYYFRPPFQNRRLMRRLKFMENLGHALKLPFGGGYMLVAKKRVSTFTPIKPVARHRLFAPTVARPVSAERR
ncbi:MAG: methyltransferase domain-containing protein [Gammaproteobacteria bacterium]|nr:MAG: methyltransferase domain-containing protein [Gammaproteobacteria bacterium]